MPIELHHMPITDLQMPVLSASQPLRRKEGRSRGEALWRRPSTCSSERVRRVLVRRTPYADRDRPAWRASSASGRGTDSDRPAC